MRRSCCQAAAAPLAILALCFGPHCTATRYTDVRGRPYTVDYDRRSIRIDGEPTLLLSGDVHYARFDADEQTRALALELQHDNLTAWLIRLGSEQPLLYALLAILMALVTGYGAALAFRR